MSLEEEFRERDTLRYCCENCGKICTHNEAIIWYESNNRLPGYDREFNDTMRVICARCFSTFVDYDGAPEDIPF